MIIDNTGKGWRIVHDAKASSSMMKYGEPAIIQTPDFTYEANCQGPEDPGEIKTHPTHGPATTTHKD